MLTKVILVAASILISISTTADVESTLYKDLRSVGFMKNDFQSQLTESGVRFDSNDTITFSNREPVSKIRIHLETPSQIPNGTTLEQAISLDINNILKTHTLNSRFPTKNRVAEGVGAAATTISGQGVGIIEYQMLSQNMAKVKRAIFVKGEKMYGFTMTLFDSSAAERGDLIFNMLITAAINSGKL